MMDLCRGKETVDMWEYEKRLQYPVKIKNPDARAAKVIISQYGGPDGELGVKSFFYLLNKRFFGFLASHIGPPFVFFVKVDTFPPD